MGRIVFVMGTDTGAGKTVLAASLVWYLRGKRLPALGMKPFCSGTRDDVRLLQDVQGGELSDEEVNPFYFSQAVAPLVALRKQGRDVRLKDALAKIRKVQRRCDVLVIEGSGGLLVPLGEGFMVADLIKALKCEVVIAARNRLGTINHTLLTVGGTKRLQPKKVSVILMNCGDRDESTQTNGEILAELLAPIRVVQYPFIGENALSSEAFGRNRKILENVLARVLD
jgi:dethiobiotin synthetase